MTDLSTALLGTASHWPPFPWWRIRHCTAACSFSKRSPGRAVIEAFDRTTAFLHWRNTPVGAETVSSPSLRWGDDGLFRADNRVVLIR